MAKKMQENNLLIVPSLCYENSPVVIFEAMGQGLPVLASNIGGIPEIIKKNGGFLFEPGNEKELITKLQEIKNSPQLLEAIGDGYKKLFQNVSSIDYLAKLIN